ncbi:MAG: lipopolysaccharide heptosyltransferase II [Thiotrichales bacterium]|nr:MAG: lipopolysaccharide heptosyltransferase II [Thiotrichales bacterium]
MPASSRRYLIIGPSWVGDMVMAQSLFIALKKLYPECEIDVVSPEWSLPVLQRMPQVRRGIALPVQHGEFSLAARSRLGRSLKANNYSHAIVLPRSWKSALVPFFAGVPVRTGYRGEMRYGLLNDVRMLDTEVLKQTVQRYVAHAYPQSECAAEAPEISYPELQSDKQHIDSLLNSLKLRLDKPVIGFMPGAEYGPAKQWPTDYFAQLSRLLVEQGYQVWVFGSTKEVALGDAIAQGATGDVHNLCGKTELVDVIDLIACVEQVVSNDSGLMHVAAAMDVKVNVIYGSSTPEYTPPLTDSAEIHYKRLSCSPCFSRTCKYGHYNCLTQVRADDVFARMLAR